MEFPPQKPQGSQADRALGMDAEMARADFLDGRPFAGPAGAPAMMAKEDWDGYGGVGDYATANGNTHAVMTAGHGIRDGLYTGELKSAQATGETFDCVVVGGGISGLAAAHLFSEKTGRSKRCLVLEDHSIFGGEARRNEFMVDGHRLMAGQGSATYFPSLPSSLTQRFYESIGFDGKPLEYQKWGGGQPELDVNTLPYARGSKNSGMFFGARFGHPEGFWLYDPWGKKLAGAPVPEATRQQLLKARAGNQTFAPPKVDGDEISRALDRITLEEHLMQRDGLTREFIRSLYAGCGRLGGFFSGREFRLCVLRSRGTFPLEERSRRADIPRGEHRYRALYCESHDSGGDARTQYLGRHVPRAGGLYQA